MTLRHTYTETKRVSFRSHNFKLKNTWKSLRNCKMCN